MEKNKWFILGIISMFFMITIILSASTIKPTARFEFTKQTFQQKEPIEFIDTSFSEAGKRITQREWQVVVNNRRRTGSNLPSLLSNAEPGQYEVFLRVKDQNSIWSDQTSRKLIIKKSEPIAITTFRVDKSLYAIGERIEFIYNYNNPNELKIRSQKWTYRNLAMGSKISGKPKYFSRAGRYEISLQIQDEWGIWSQPKTCIVQVGTEKIERDGYYLFTKGKQGDLLEGYIDKDYNTLETVETVTYEDKPGILIVSNSPESIPSSGILYRDTVKGGGRLLVHHANVTNVPKKLVVLATVSGSQPVHLSISNQAIKGPHRDILGSGQAALRDYFKGNAKKSYTLIPGQTISIYDSRTIKAWNKNEVISGMFNFESSGDITFTVAALDHNSSLDNLSRLNVLKKDVHIRGTFNVTERYYTVDLDNIKSPSKITIGRGSDEWVNGRDALTGESVQNRGNYGVSVFIKIKNHEDIGIILNARGGAYQGAIKWHNNKVFDTPTEEVLTSNKIATLVGMVKANAVNEFEYMLPNGSAAPVLFGFVPERFWK